MKKLSRYISFLLLLSIVISCSEEKKNKQKTTQTIKIALSEIISDNYLSISYQVPQNWDEMPASLSEKMVGRVRKQGVDEFIIYTPKSFYYNSTNSSLLRIGEIKFKNNLSSDSLSIETYVKLFQKYNRDLEIETTNITNNNITIKQIKIIKNNLVSFKYLFRNNENKIIQLDFSIKKEKLLKLKPHIDASVNSIILL